MKIKKSVYHVATETLDGKNEPKSERILFSTRTGKGIKITNFVYELFTQENFAVVPDRLFTIFMYYELLVPADENELVTMVKRKQLIAIDTTKREISFFLKEPVLSKELSLLKLFNPYLPEISNHISKNIISDNWLNFVFYIPEMKIGLEQFNDLKKELSNSLPVNTSIDFLFLDKNIENLADFLPIRNSFIRKLIFQIEIVKNGIDKIIHQLTLLKNLIERSSYLKDLSIEIHLIIDLPIKENLPFLVKKIKDFSSFKKLIFHVHIEKGSNEKEEEIFEHFELEIIYLLSKEQVKVAFMPIIDCSFIPSYANKSNDAVNNTFLQKKGDSELRTSEIQNIVANGTLAKLRQPYNSFFTTQLLEKKIICSDCIFLPMCGGREDKLPATTKDCPVFIRNFSKKILYHYNFSF